MDTTRRPNQDTPERWAKPWSGPPLRASSSASSPPRRLDRHIRQRFSEMAYIVTADTCECRAGAEGDPVCKHRAALRQRLGS